MQYRRLEWAAAELVRLEMPMLVALPKLWLSLALLLAVLTQLQQPSPLLPFTLLQQQPILLLPFPLP